MTAAEACSDASSNAVSKLSLSSLTLLPTTAASAAAPDTVKVSSIFTLYPPPAPGVSVSSFRLSSFVKSLVERPLPYSLSTLLSIASDSVLMDSNVTRSSIFVPEPTTWPSLSNRASCPVYPVIRFIANDGSHDASNSSIIVLAPSLSTDATARSTNSFTHLAVA